MSMEEWAARAAILTDVVHIGVGASLLLWRKHMHPIRGRSVFLVVVSALFITSRNIAVATLIAYHDELGDCSPVDLASDVLIFCGVVAVFLRVWRLWFMFYSAVEKLDGERRRADMQAADRVTDSVSVWASASKNSANEPRTWFKEYRHLVRDRFFAKFLAVVGAVYAAIGCTLFFAPENRLDHIEDPWFENSSHCFAVQANNMLIIMVSALVLLLMIYTAVKLRKVKDSFYIKLELKLLSVWAIVFGARALFSVFGLLANLYIVQFYMVITIDLPVILSFSSARRQRRKSTKQCEIPKLFEILTNDDLLEIREHYKEQLIREFAIENYLFFNETREFKCKYEASLEDAKSPIEDARQQLMCEDPRMQDLTADALRIYLDYVPQGSPNQVNISHKTRVQVEERMSKLMPTFFQEETRGNKKRRSLTKRFSFPNKRAVATCVGAHTSSRGKPELEQVLAKHSPRVELSSLAKLPPTKHTQLPSIPSVPRASVEMKPSVPRASVEMKPSVPRASVETKPSVPRAPVEMKPPMASVEMKPSVPRAAVEIKRGGFVDTACRSHEAGRNSESGSASCSTTRFHDASFRDASRAGESSAEGIATPLSSVRVHDLRQAQADIAAPKMTIAEYSKIFDEAQAEILELMERDSFRFWKRIYAKKLAP